MLRAAGESPGGAATTRISRSLSPAATTAWEVSQIPSLRDFRSAHTPCDEGQTMAEYTVVLGVITLAIVTAIATLSGVIDETIAGVAGLF